MLRSTPYGVECTEYVTRIIKDKISIAAIHAVQTAKSLHLVAFSFFGLFVNWFLFPCLSPAVPLKE